MATAVGNDSVRKAIGQVGMRGFGKWGKEEEGECNKVDLAGSSGHKPCARGSIHRGVNRDRKGERREKGGKDGDAVWTEWGWRDLTGGKGVANQDRTDWWGLWKDGEHGEGLQALKWGKAGVRKKIAEGTAEGEVGSMCWDTDGEVRPGR